MKEGTKIKRQGWEGDQTQGETVEYTNVRLLYGSQA